MSSTAGDLTPEVLRQLELGPGTHPHANLWLSATSGLVCIGRNAYVIADDEHHLGHFHLDTRDPVRLLQLFEGALPRDKGKRKKAKPDLESLALLPPMEFYPHGALLALGSGSRPQRCRAMLLALDAEANALEPPMQVDLTALYRPLEAQFGDLNIEGAFVAGGQMHLLQRGNKGNASARIGFEWHTFAGWLLGDAQVPVAASVQLLDLGRIDGVPLAPTDAAALANGTWIFCAVAEDTGDSYHDGACLASLVGIADAHGRIERMHHLHGNPKVEGIALAPGSAADGGLEVLLVTDADDPHQPSCLLRCTLPQL